MSPDGITYTFHLRSGVKFSSGRPVNAAAVKYSFERSINMGGCGGYFIYDGIYTPPLIKSITTPNALTVVITLSTPDANVLQDWAQPASSIIDKSVVDKHGGVQKGKVNTYMAGHVTPGAGPYLLQSYEPNKSAVLVANPGFFKQPAAKKVVINFISSDPTLVLQARNGSADVTLGLTQQLMHDGSLTYVGSKLAGIPDFLSMNVKKPPFNNKALRQAVAWALDKNEIRAVAYFGAGENGSEEVPSGSVWHDNADPYKDGPNLTKAKQLIAASGVQTPVSVSMNIQAGNAVDEQVATIAQGSWQQLGVNVTINKLSPSDYINSLEQHKAQSYVRLDGPGVIEAGYFLGYDLKCGIGFNLSATCIKKADTLLAQGRKTFNKAKRQAIWNQINSLWIAASPKIPVYGDKYVAVVNKRVKNYFYSHETDFTTWSK